MGNYDPDLVLNGEPLFERASHHLGELKRLPPVTFRGLECSLLAEQYRRLRGLEKVSSCSIDEIGQSAGFPQHRESKEDVSSPRS